MNGENVDWSINAAGASTYIESKSERGGTRYRLLNLLGDARSIELNQCRSIDRSEHAPANRNLIQPVESNSTDVLWWVGTIQPKARADRRHAPAPGRWGARCVDDVGVAPSADN